MTDPSDDDALSWDGDAALAAPQRPAPLIDDGARTEGGRASGGGFALTTGAGTPLEVFAYALNLAGRVLAVLAPVVWFAAVAWRVRLPSRRLALLVLGALLLVPWPAILAVA
jgi:hypothetical protein